MVSLSYLVRASYKLIIGKNKYLKRLFKYNKIYCQLKYNKKIRLFKTVTSKNKIIKAKKVVLYFDIWKLKKDKILISLEHLI